MNKLMTKLYVKTQVKAAQAKGQTLAEYALILALIAVVCIGALQGLSGAVQGSLNNVAGALGG